MKAFGTSIPILASIVIVLAAIVGVALYLIGQAPANQPPVADFSYSPISPTTQDVIQFTDESSDPDGSIASWSWDFGDETTSEDQDPTHQYADDGTYTITLMVTDNDEATDNVSKEVTVLNVEPTADAGGPYEVDENGSVALDGTGSSDSDGTITYLWTITDDPTEEATLTDANTATPTFNAPAVDADTTVTVQLIVTDDDGATDSETATVNVVNVGKWSEATYVNPTETSPGDVWSVPLTGTTSWESYSDEIHVNTGDQNLGAFVLEIAHDNSIIVPTDVTGPDGWTIVPNFEHAAEGQFIVGGFTATAPVQGNDVTLLTITWICKGTGTTVLDLTVTELTDYDTGGAVGTPNGIDGMRTLI